MKGWLRASVSFSPEPRAGRSTAAPLTTAFTDSWRTLSYRAYGSMTCGTQPQLTSVATFRCYRTDVQLQTCVNGFERNVASRYHVRIQKWRGRDGNDPSVDIAKDADQRF